MRRVVYVALLRGINVGGKTKIPMAALRDTCAAAGCEDVVTYIQSGNIVLKSTLSAEKLRAALEEAIAREFGFNPAVMIRTARSWPPSSTAIPIPTPTTRPSTSASSTPPPTRQPRSAWPPSTAGRRS